MTRLPALLRAWAVRLSLAFLLLLLLVCCTPSVRWAGRRLSGPLDSPRGEILIVLGGAVQDDGILGLNSYWRAVYALRAWRAGGFSKIVVSGGGKPPVSVAMRDFLVGHGVPSDAIILESGSRNTRENASAVARLLAGVPGRRVLLTSDYHMFRARRLFTRAGLDVLPRSCPDVTLRGDSWLARFPAFLDLSIEAVKILYYRARGWL